MANLEFKYNEAKGYYDIYGSNGHLTKTQGLESQLYSSLFCDSRADDSEQPIKSLQRGWAGNVIVAEVENYEIGCKQWIYTEQGKLTNQNISAIIDTIRNDGLQWMIDDELCEDIEIEIYETDFKKGKLVLDINFKINENNIDTKRLTLWTLTEQSI